MKLMPVDLTNCDREPIHIPGAIQPHGVLVVFRASDQVITHASENAEAIIGTPCEKLLGARIESLFVESEASDRQQSLIRDVIDAQPVYLFTLRLRSAPTLFDAIAHLNGDLIFIELEPARQNRTISAPELYRLVQRSAMRLHQPRSVVEMCRVCAEQVRSVNGFDRVMVYRFDAEWNGQVVAEDRQESLEPFLGLHYPASDIPQQARELYTRNLFRFIPDRDYAPSAVIGSREPGFDHPLDMTFSVLRSVSPIHLEYLRNMGVGASMSISLILEGRLWGLIACHHQSPRFVPYDIRTACELLGQMMSLHLAATEQREVDQGRADGSRVREAILANVEQQADLAIALGSSEPNVLALIDADGAAVVLGDRVIRLGQTPGEDEIRKLSTWVAATVGADAFATDHLRSVYGSALLGTVASGLMAISITDLRTHQILWFRTEQVRTVHWAGDPAKSVAKGDEVRLSPRGSFALWKETVKGRSKPWSEGERALAQLLRDGILRQLLRRAEQLAAAHTDMWLAGQEREKLLEAERAARAEAERASEMKDEFVANLSHELRTPLNAILGWAEVLTHTENLDEDVKDGLEVIQRNARSQAQMIEDLLEVSRIISGNLRLELAETNLPIVVDAAIETVALAAAARDIKIEKRAENLSGLKMTADASRLQQVVWNLLSNAIKFTPRGGKIQVVLQRVDSHVELSVSDSGDGIKADFLPYVFDRFRQAEGSVTRSHNGLGLGLSIVRNLVELHGGNVYALSRGEGHGATFVVSLPASASEASGPGSGVGPVDTSPNANLKPEGLVGLKLLLVDDETDALELLKRIFVSCGCSVTTTTTALGALQLLERAPFDVIISDVGMPGTDGYVLIRQWREIEEKLNRAITPAIALTAYAAPQDRDRAIRGGFQLHLSKPVAAGALLTAVVTLAKRR